MNKTNKAVPEQNQKATRMWKTEKQGRAGWLLIAKEFKTWCEGKSQAEVLIKYHNEVVAELQCVMAQLADFKKLYHETLLDRDSLARINDRLLAALRDSVKWDETGNSSLLMRKHAITVAEKAIK